MIIFGFLCHSNNVTHGLAIAHINVLVAFVYHPSLVLLTLLNAISLKFSVKKSKIYFCRWHGTAANIAASFCDEH